MELEKMTKAEVDQLQEYLSEIAALYESEPDLDPQDKASIDSWQSWDRRCLDLTEQNQGLIKKALDQLFKNKSGQYNPQFAAIILASLLQSALTTDQDHETDAFPTVSPSTFYLKPLASLPSAEMQTFLVRILSAGRKGVQKSTVTRSEQISFYDYEENLTPYTRYTRKNRGKEQTVVIADPSDILTGRNKTFLKMFVFSLQKMAQQNTPRSVAFHLQELVANGMYKSVDTARRAVNTFFQQQGKIQLFQSSKTKNQKREQGGFLFYNIDITNNFVTLSVNDKFPVLNMLAKQYTIFPRFAYGLSAQAFVLVHYIFSLARQNTKSITENGSFNISLDAIRNQLGLPSVKELSVRSQYKQLIQKPIENAISEIEEAVQRTQDDYDGTFTITKFATETHGIRAWLEGYVTIRLTGGYASSFQVLSEKRSRLIETFKQEKAIEQVKLPTKAEIRKKSSSLKKD